MINKQKDSTKKASGGIRRATRQQPSAREELRIALERLHGESGIAGPRHDAKVGTNLIRGRVQQDPTCLSSHNRTA